MRVAKKICHLLAGSAGLLAYLSCGGGSGATTSPHGTDIYISGFEKGTSGSGSGTSGGYWQNGKRVRLISPAVAPASVNSVAVLSAFGGEVLAVGTNSGGTSGGYGTVATYWVNGHPTALAPASDDSFANAFAVSGQDLYIAGSRYPGSGLTSDRCIATYWKNGVAVPLTSGATYAYASCIGVSGSDVYVGGEQYGGAKHHAMLWKNGVGIPLTDGTQDSEVYALAIQGSDVYAVGYESNGTNPVAKYWKNGIPTPLGDGVFRSFGCGIAVIGSDVYIAGSHADAHHDLPVYWKNGTEVPLSLPSGAWGDTQAKAIAVSGTDIHVVAVGNATSADTTALYWKNGVVVPMTDVPYDPSGFTSIYVDVH